MAASPLAVRVPDNHCAAPPHAIWFGTDTYPDVAIVVRVDDRTNGRAVRIPDTASQFLGDRRKPQSPLPSVSVPLDPQTRAMRFPISVGKVLDLACLLLSQSRPGCEALLRIHR